MQFQPFINQLIADADHKYLLANPLTLAALGASDSQVRKHRPKLSEGQHFVYATGTDNLRRLFYTFKGLIELTSLLNTERSNAFRGALMSVATGGAMVHKPAGQIAPVVCHSEPGNNIQPSQLHSPQQQPEMPHGLSPEVFSELVALKRDEIELQRSRQETERLYILQAAYEQQQPAPIARPKANDPLLVVVQNNENNRGRLRDDPLAVVAVLTAFIFLCSLIMVSFSVVLGSSNNRETQVNVR